MGTYTRAANPICIACGWRLDHPYHLLHVPHSRRPAVRVEVTRRIDEIASSPIDELPLSEFEAALDGSLEVSRETSEFAYVHLCGFEAKSKAGLAAHARHCAVTNG